ncbi:MAG: histidinol-phosphatase HisJ family protein [Eubacterium sp.]|jgi:histidinol-phosphatase (PHP family)|nr:histidinol-phosphatase HisJ family protein [Eubacterium sp.]
MSENILMDLHTHSTLSHDGSDEIRKNIERAVMLGIKVFATTEHIDLNVYYDKRYKNNILIKRGNKIINDLKKEYEKDIKIIYGVEFAQGIHNKALADKITDEFRFDYILGSVHTIRGEQDFYYIDYKSRDANNLLKRYFDEIIEMIDWGNIDAVAHLTYPLRYIIGRDGLNFDIKMFDDKIREIFRLMTDKKIALELNACGLRIPRYNRPDPDFDYIKIYKMAGGELLTIGSDSHSAAHVGSGVREAQIKAVECGFDKLVYFENRKPCFLSLT